VRPWAFATVLFALAWLLTLAWGLHRRPAATPKPPDPRGGRSTAAAAVATTSLRRALQAGDLGDIGDALRASADPPAESLDAVAFRLADPAQRDALAQLQQARWGDGDPAAAREALRAAFRAGPRWKRHAGQGAGGPLPPLYP
jgi:hypothetical protein